MNNPVTLPRSVVEQALEALEEADLLMDHRQNIELRRSALVALRAALEQPQGEQSYMEGVTAGRHKLASEYPLPTDLYDSKDWRCGTYAERVEWLHTMYEDAKEQIAALEQPTSEDCSGVEQKPSVIIAFDDGKREPRLVAWNQLPVGQHCLYTHPQPKREPLTDEEILKLAYLLRWDEVDDFEADRAINFAQIIERAHGIGSKE